MMTWDLLRPIGPALALAALFLFGIPLFALRVRLKGYPEVADADHRKTSAIASNLIQRYVYWLLGPIERGLSSLGVSPNAITAVSLVMCGLSGFYAATGHFAAAAWIYLGSGMLDILDGRVARRTGKATRSGGLLDSVVDRWAELLVLGGLVLAMRTTFERFAVLVCIAGSMMVSYTRARGEAAGVKIMEGTMQRAERMVLVAISMLVAAVGICIHTYDPYYWMAAGILVVGVLSSGTAIVRLYKGFVELRNKEFPKAADEPATSERFGPQPLPRSE